MMFNPTHTVWEDIRNPSGDIILVRGTLLRFIQVATYGRSLFIDSCGAFWELHRRDVVTRLRPDQNENLQSYEVQLTGSRFEWKSFYQDMDHMRPVDVPGSSGFPEYVTLEQARARELELLRNIDYLLTKTVK